MSRRCECGRLAGKRCAICGDSVCIPCIQVKVIERKMEVVCVRCHSGKGEEDEG